MLRVIVIGMGPIGFACARAIHAQRDLRLVGMVDLDPAKVGKTLADLNENDAGPVPADPGPRVADHIDRAIVGGADVAVLTTSSNFASVAPTLRELLDRGLAVVSSCEQMVWPRYRHAALAEEIDAYAKRAGRAALGTGVNPGFVMDTLAVVLATMVRRVTGVRCERRLDASMRRRPLQAKVGATMTPERFAELAKDNKIGHQGLAESVAMLAWGMGREVAPGSVEERLEPVIADKPINSALGLIEPGRVAGIHNTARWAGDGLTVEMDLTMACGLADPRDMISLEGPVELRLKIPGATPGDSATVAALLNHIPLVYAASSGLRTMLDMPPAGCRGRDRDVSV